MVEGWLVQESMVYIINFFASIDHNIPLQWHNKDDEHIVERLIKERGLRGR